jgi:demethylmenaquinone methyltransferase/2-methoxy-6-polyprenyl-1,4-benzoquinol methylase
MAISEARGVSSAQIVISGQPVRARGLRREAAMIATKPAERGRTDEERAYYALNARVYSKFAPFYDPLVRPIRRLRREVVNLSGATADSKVLDLATGTGEQALAFAAISRVVVGVDLSDDMLRKARWKNRRENVTFMQGDASDLPFEEGAFDIVSVSLAMHEMPASIRRAVLKEMVRVTKPNGTLVLVDYGLPRSRFARFLVYHAVKLYEGDHYADFIRSDLDGTAHDVGIVVRENRPVLFGVGRLLIGSKVTLEERGSTPGNDFMERQSLGEEAP